MTRNNSVSYTTPIQNTEHVRIIERDEGKINPVLFDLLSHRTPHGQEAYIRDKIIKPFLSKACKNTPKHHVDDKGNLIVKIGQAGKDHKTMFSSHMDTVHVDGNNEDGPVVLMVTEGTGKVDKDDYVYGATQENVVAWEDTNDGQQYTTEELAPFATKGRFYRVEDAYDEGMTETQDHLFIVKDYTNKVPRHDDPGEVKDAGPFKRIVTDEVITDPSVLGADDKLGIYIMLRLIEAGVPGLYVFHVGEECGGKGSGWIADNTPDLVKNVDHCIAFDRRGHTDIIHNQAGGKCISDAFGTALKSQLDPLMPPQVTWNDKACGTFTDSANYTHLISECTNLSVGYYSQHTTSECFDLFWLEQILIPAMQNVDWYSLPADRDPNQKSSGVSTWHGGWGHTRGNYSPPTKQQPNVSSRNYANPPKRQPLNVAPNVCLPIRTRSGNNHGGDTTTYTDGTFKYYNAAGLIVYAGWTMDLDNRFLNPLEYMKAQCASNLYSYEGEYDSFTVTYADGHWQEYDFEYNQLDSSFEKIGGSSSKKEPDYTDWCSREHWDNGNYCPPWEVDEDTPQGRIPPWNPRFGMYPFTSERQMEIIVKNYILMNHRSPDQTAKMVVRMTKRMHHLNGIVKSKL